MRGSELLLTQTDTLLQMLGSDTTPGSRVQHLVFSNLSFSHTSAQFFRPHEETSGGDYSTHRSGAVKLENATGVQLLANDFQWIGGASSCAWRLRVLDELGKGALELTRR